MREKKGGVKMELAESMKTRHAELTAEKARVDQELKAVEAYLKAIGELAPKKRGRKPKQETD